MWLIRFGLALLMKSGLLWLPVLLVGYKLKEVGKKKEGKEITILALSSERFRGDLEVLSAKGGFRVLVLPTKLQYLIFSFYYGRKYKCTLEEFFNLRVNSRYHRSRVKYRLFLTKFLMLFYRKYAIDCVISAAFHYKHDYDWGVISKNIGVPYIVMHRENLIASKAMEIFFIEYAKRLNKFEGSHAIVQNEVVTDILERVGFCNAKTISALGCLRMDEYVNKINSMKTSPSIERKSVVLFSFLPGFALFSSPDIPYDHWPKNRDHG